MEQKEIKTFKPKLRIQYLEENGIVISDRLVDQSIEFTTGPKITHQGPIKIEVTLTSKNDIESFKEYIDQLTGNLPTKVIGTRGRTANPQTEFNSPREEILETVKADVTSGLHQDGVIRYLRGLGFVFMLTEDFLTYFPEFPFKGRDIGEPSNTGQYPASLQWMVRCIKRAKDPKSDKYDPQIIFGIQIMLERSAKVIPYLYKERKKPLFVEVPSKNALSFNNTELTKFPKYMIEEERLKFSTEMRQLIAMPDRKPTKFFLRWFKDVIFSNDMKVKMEEAINR